MYFVLCCVTLLVVRQIKQANDCIWAAKVAIFPVMASNHAPNGSCFALFFSFSFSLFGISSSSFCRVFFFAPFKRQTLVLSLVSSVPFSPMTLREREERFWVVPNGTCALVPFPPFPCFFNRNKHHTLNAYRSFSLATWREGKERTSHSMILTLLLVKINDLGSSWTLEVRFVYVSSIYKTSQHSWRDIWFWPCIFLHPSFTCVNGTSKLVCVCLCLCVWF